MRTLLGLAILALPAAAQDSPWGPGYNDFMRTPPPAVRRAPRPETLPYVPPRPRRTMDEFGYRGIGDRARPELLRPAPRYESDLDYRDYGPSPYGVPDYLSRYVRR